LAGIVGTKVAGVIGLHALHRYYLYSQPTDMRKSFDGLSGLVRNHLKRNPTDGEVYVFLNRDRSIIKLLQWDRSGFSIYSKRLERGSFERPRPAEDQTSRQLSWEELVLILEGISLDSVRRRKRYALPGQEGLRSENQAKCH
jgi:transposase